MRKQLQFARLLARHSLILTGVLLASVVYPRSSGNSDGDLRAIATATDDYLPGPVELVSPSRVLHGIHWQDDDLFPDPRGRYVLIRHHEPNFPPVSVLDSPLTGEVSLLLYDSHTGRVKTIWQRAAPEPGGWKGDISWVQWMAGTDNALVVTGEEPVAMADPAKPRADSLLQATSPYDAYVESKKSGPGDDRVSRQSLLLVKAPLGGGTHTVHETEHSLGLVRTQNDARLAVVEEMNFTKLPNGGYRRESRYSTVDAQGAIKPLVTFDDGGYDGDVSWNTDGTVAYFVRSYRGLPDADGTPTFTPRYSAVDVKTGTVTDLKKRPVVAEPKQLDNVLRLVSAEVVANSPSAAASSRHPADTMKFHPLYLMRGDNKPNDDGMPDSTMIAPNADASYLLPDDSAVLYISQQTLYSVPLVRIAKADYAQLVAKVTYQHAKQIALALKGYTEDYDNCFPLAGDLGDRFNMVPYVHSVNVFDNPATGADGFVYKLDGDGALNANAMKLKIAGYLTCPFGKATIYADGHVDWAGIPIAPEQ